jgi:biopolymer transport protein ExbD
MRIELGDDEPPEIGLIALIDCIFFLLMFFMVATSFKQKAATSCSSSCRTDWVPCFFRWC